MGGESMGLSDIEMETIVKKWRDKNPAIVSLWSAVEGAAIRAIKSKKVVVLNQYRNLAFEYDGKALTIQLPSGRKLFYQTPEITKNKWDRESIKYKGVDQVTKKWWWVDSYGGKFVENIVQAIARDLLAYSMVELDKQGFKIVMHVHDEVVCEVAADGLTESFLLEDMCRVMGQEVPWAKGLPLTADGYITPFYKKD